MVHNSKTMLEKGLFFTTIEIPLHGSVKYEVDKESGKLLVDRVLNVAMGYPCNYGYIEKTHGSDGDPIDVCLILDKPLFPGSIVYSKAVGVLLMEDESGIDEKILAVPVKSEFNELNDLEDVSKNILLKIKHFFERYKDLEDGKWVKVYDWKGRDEAVDILMKSFKIFL